MRKSLWFWVRLSLGIGMLTLLLACGTKKIGLTTGEACESSDQCLSSNCAEQAGLKTCQPKAGNGVCSAGSTQSCVCSNGQSGNQTCEAGGKAWGACTCTGGPPQKCVPNSTQACTCADGKSGSQTCNADGQAYGTCACTGGPLCTPGGTQACVCPDGKNGSQSCNSDGKGWGTCKCQGGGNVCSPGGTQACTCPDGKSGSQTCNSDGKGWGTCQCQGGGNKCVPNSTQACTCADGKSGSQTCSPDGQSYSACKCQGNPQGKAIGTPCQNDNECQGGHCIEKSGGSPYCSQKCTSTDCPSGYACADFSETLQVCGKVRPNAKPVGQGCANIFECQSLVCWRGVCTSRCESTPCPSGQNCVKYHGSLKFCSAGVCEPANFNAATACSKNCQNAQCVAQCQSKHLSSACQNCYANLAQCVNNTGCNASSPSCCAPQQKACFGGI